MQQTQHSFTRPPLLSHGFLGNIHTGQTCIGDCRVVVLVVVVREGGEGGSEKYNVCILDTVDPH